MVTIENKKNPIKWLRNRFKPLNGYGVLFEFAVFVVINNYYLIPNFFPIDSLKDTIKSLTITEIITILTASVIAIGFLYYLGYISAAKITHQNVPHPLQYIVSFHGSLFFLGVFLPVLIAVSSAFEQSNILGFILINIIVVMGVGFFNEILACHPNPNPKVTLIMVDVDETSNGKPREDLKYHETRNADYIFKDEQENRIIIPIAQVKEIRFHDDKEFE
jgi:hypothetical protein